MYQKTNFEKSQMMIRFDGVSDKCLYIYTFGVVQY